MKMHAPLFPLAVCLMLGVAVADRLPDWTTGLAVLVVCAACTVLLSRWPRCQTIGLWICSLLIGMTLTSRHRQQLEVEWPKEQVCVKNAYPTFVDWAKDVSNPTAKNWYMYPEGDKVIKR